MYNAGERCSCAFCMVSHWNPCNKAAWIAKLNHEKDSEHLEGCRPGRGLAYFTLQDNDLQFYVLSDGHDLIAEDRNAPSPTRPHQL